MDSKLKIKADEQVNKHLLEDSADEDDITVEWLWEHLRTAFPQASGPWFSELEIDELFGGYNSEVLRISLISNSTSRASELPTSIVKKRVHSWLEVHESEHEFEDPYVWMARNEIRFFRDIAPLVTIKFPKIYWATPLDSPGPYDIFMEDLGEQKTKINAYWTVEQTKELICALAQLHSALWTPKHKQLGWISRFIVPSSSASVLEFCRPIWEAFCTSPLVPDFSRAAAEFVLKNPAILDLLLSRPSTILYYDLRQSNILTNKASEVVWVDPALASIGLGVTDVLHLIKDTFTAGSRDALEQELLEFYWGNLSSEIRQTYSKADLYLDRDLATIDGLIGKTVIMGMLNPDNVETLSRTSFSLSRCFLLMTDKIHANFLKPIQIAAKNHWNVDMYRFAKQWDAYANARAQQVLERLKQKLG